MKIFYDPKVYLISSPQINWDAVQEFFRDMNNYGKNFLEDVWRVNNSPAWVSEENDGDLLPEFCGRMCYCSFGERQGRVSNAEYLANIVQSGHGSVLEHANFTFLVTQCSRGFTHQMVRHRAGFAYSQESTHYIDYNPENGRICLDIKLCALEDIPEAMIEHAETALQIYQNLYSKLIKNYDKKTACSMVRQMLPIGIESKLAFTGNLRALRHFCYSRGNEHNVLEIRKIAVQVFEILKLEAPNAMQGLILQHSTDGFKSIKAMFGEKV
jgi:thymidylate synthase (FAD)